MAEIAHPPASRSSLLSHLTGVQRRHAMRIPTLSLYDLQHGLFLGDVVGLKTCGAAR